jgi:hypothetical protein
MRKERSFVGIEHENIHQHFHELIELHGKKILLIIEINVGAYSINFDISK